MTIAYLDTFSGISGDMTIGAFVSAGVPIESLRTELKNLDVQGYDISAKQVVKSGITATKVDVELHGKQASHRHLTDILKMIEDSSLRDASRSAQRACSR